MCGQCTIDGVLLNNNDMCFSVLLPERLAGCMRLRWSISNKSYRMNNIVHYEVSAKDSLLKNAFIMKGSGCFYKSSNRLKCINMESTEFYQHNCSKYQEDKYFYGFCDGYIARNYRRRFTIPERKDATGMGLKYANLWG